jgi:hypothetical protein
MKIKNFLHLDYPCGNTTGYYAKVMLLRSTGKFFLYVTRSPCGKPQGILKLIKIIENSRFYIADIWALS